jgi:hypothetical protein
MITPYVFYLLCRRLKLDKTRSLYATLIFSIIPTVVLNSVFFGRFPNIVGYPFFIATLIFAIEALQTHSKRSIFLSSIFFGATLLCHHLSAYILAVIIVIYALAFMFEKTSFRLKLLKMFSTGGLLIIGCVIAGFWLIPFILYSSYFGQELSSLSFRLLPISLTFLIILILTTVYFVKKMFPSVDFHSRFMLTFFIIFLVLGLGFLNQYILPFGNEIDFLRFQVYMAIPAGFIVATLKNYQVTKINISSKIREKFQRIPFWIGVLLILNLIIGITVIQAAPTVLDEKVYVEEIPEPIIEYLNSTTTFGRILAVDCPFWIYILPYYTNKSLVDGWYPQGCVIQPIKQASMANDRNIFKWGETIDSSKNETAINYFVQHSQDYGIKWILCGNESKLYLFDDSSFKATNLKSGRYTLLENSLNISYVDALPNAEIDWSIQRETNSITLYVNTKAENTTITVKEAYFPGWHIYEEDKSIAFTQNSHGFITFNIIGAGQHKVQLMFTPPLIPESFQITP